MDNGLGFMIGNTQDHSYQKRDMLRNVVQIQIWDTSFLKNRIR